MPASPGIAFPIGSSALGRREQRLAGAALGLSLAVHLAVLGLVPDWRPDTPPAPSSIQVTLLAPPSPALAPTPAPVAATPVVPPPPARVVKAAPPPDRPVIVARREPAPTAPRVPQPAPAPEPAMPVADAGVAPAPAASMPAPAAAPEALARSTAPAPALAEPVPAVDPDLLARYGQTLSQLLARQQRYPRLAEVRGWEGEVVLKLVIARKGQLVGVHIVRSSGHAVLDESAVALVNAAQPFPALSAQAGGADLEVTVPVHYHFNKKS